VIVQVADGLPCASCVRRSDIFEMEQKEYAAEKIDVAHVSYIDNQPCLDLIENGKGSILGMTDEELKLPGGGDENLLTRMHQAHQTNKYYVKPKTMSALFSVNHYGQTRFRSRVSCVAML
jgi:myosin heavy subunit